MKNAGISIICCILTVLISILAITIPRNKKTIETKKINVFLAEKDKVVTLDLEEYVLNVLRGEMPADFEIEALKSQAVAIRTYALKKIGSNIDVHKGGDVCDDYRHCMAYVDEDKAKNNWKENFKKNNEKLKKAVKETEGLIAEYEGKPITAVFHAISSGKTENSYEVWNGSVLPYLSTVDSEVDQNVEGYSSETVVSKKDFADKTGTNSTDVKYEYTHGGGVKKAIIGDKEFTGGEMRKLFGLRSANFSISFKDDQVIFSVKGYGHGVGMSQRGANEYAKQGMKFDDILKKYYKGISIKKYY